jgi:hypothetical protein
MDALLVLPSTPSLPPIKAAKAKELEIFESRALSILSIATMAGCCQVSLSIKSQICMISIDYGIKIVNCMILLW